MSETPKRGRGRPPKRKREEQEEEKGEVQERQVYPRITTATQSTESKLNLTPEQQEQLYTSAIDYCAALGTEPVKNLRNIARQLNILSYDKISKNKLCTEIGNRLNKLIEIIRENEIDPPDELMDRISLQPLIHAKKLTNGVSYNASTVEQMFANAESKGHSVIEDPEKRADKQILVGTALDDDNISRLARQWVIEQGMDLEEMDRQEQEVYEEEHKKRRRKERKEEKKQESSSSSSSRALARSLQDILDRSRERYPLPSSSSFSFHNSNNLRPVPISLVDDEEEEKEGKEGKEREEKKETRLSTIFNPSNFGGLFPHYAGRQKQNVLYLIQQMYKTSEGKSVSETFKAVIAILIKLGIDVYNPQARDLGDRSDSPLLIATAFNRFVISHNNRAYFMESIDIDHSIRERDIYTTKLFNVTKQNGVQQMTLLELIRHLVYLNVSIVYTYRNSLRSL